MKKNWFLFLLLFAVATIYGQDYFRIKADFTVKVKNADDQLNLTRGQIFYDKNYKELIYEVSFPEKEKWVMKDTTLTKIKKDKPIETASIPAINEFTIFHLALNVSLNDFGLEESAYKMVKVEKKENLVLSYWTIPNNIKSMENYDYIVIAKNQNRLVSVVIVGDNGKILSKQFFKDYEKIGAFDFPKRVVQISYDIDNRENFQVFDFKNIKINDLENDEKYRYR
jgi:hypothetical protein